MTKISFDTEFTGLHKDTTLISIGLIADSGETFYGEFTDYDKNQVDKWIQKNVIDNLILVPNLVVDNKLISMELSGTKDVIKFYLKEWLNQFDTIEWVSDVSHYDFVLLIDLVYGHALKMPYGKRCSACHDINQDIANFYNIGEIEAFDKSREEIIETYGVEIKGNKHNSLYDAKVIQTIYEELCIF